MEITFSTLIDMFITTKQTEGKSKKTTNWYKEKLSLFNKYLSNSHEAKLPDFTLEAARDYVASLQARDSRFADHPYRPTQEGKLSTFTIHGHVRTLKAFASWLEEEGFTKANVLAKLKRPKLAEPMIEILSDEEIERIINLINPNSLLGGRMYAIMLTLLDTGIRATECCTLTLENTHLDQDYIKVVGKGNKERIVSFGATTKKALIRYLTTWRPQPANERINTVFLSPQGAAMTYSGLCQSIKRLGRNADVPRLRAHLFRHTFAVRYLMNGGDVMTLRLILGHTTIEVTQVYMHLADAHVKTQQHLFSPVDRLGIKPKKRS